MWNIKKLKMVKSKPIQNKEGLCRNLFFKYCTYAYHSNFYWIYFHSFSYTVWNQLKTEHFDSKKSAQIGLHIENKLSGPPMCTDKKCAKKFRKYSILVPLWFGFNLNTVYTDYSVYIRVYSVWTQITMVSLRNFLAPF
jgi:hypothetical protein